MLKWIDDLPPEVHGFTFTVGLVFVVALMVATCEGCTPHLEVRLDRVPGGERATVSLDGEPAVVLSSETTLTVEEP